MIIDVYDKIFQEYKQFLTEHSKYAPRVVKINTNTSTYFPVVSCELTNKTDTDFCTIDYFEKYQEHYFTINIYTKDKQDDLEGTISSQIINDELAYLTELFFGEKLRMKLTLNSPTPNLDISVLRKTMQYQSLIGSVRENIIRR